MSLTNEAWTLTGGVPVGGGGGAAPDNAKYVLNQGNALLPNGQNLSILASGIAQVTTATGLISTTTQISQALIVPLDVITSFTDTSAGTYEVGQTLASTTFNWTMTRNGAVNTSQILSGTQLTGSPVTVAPGTVRTYAATFTGVLNPSVPTNYIYNLATVGDDVTYGAPSGNPSSANVTIAFELQRYWGVSGTDVLTGAEVISVLQPQFSEFATSRPVSKVFDASAGSPPNYLYFAYPAAFGAIAGSTFNGFTFTDYSYSNGSAFGNASPTALTLTNVSGGTANYYIVRTNNTYNGAGLTWAIS